MPNKLDWWVRSRNPLRFRWTLDNDSQEVQIKWILIVFLSPWHDRDPPALTLNFKINYGLLHKNEEGSNLLRAITTHFALPSTTIKWLNFFPWRPTGPLITIPDLHSILHVTDRLHLSLISSDYPENCSKCNNKKSVPYTVTYIKRKTQSHTVWWQLIRVYWGVMRGR